MRYYCNLLMSDILIPKKERVLADIEERRPSLNRFLIVLPDREDENLEIHHSSVLKQIAWKNKEWFIVGISAGYQDALDIVLQLTQCAYNHTENVNIREYILEQQRQFEEGNRWE